MAKKSKLTFDNFRSSTWQQIRDGIIYGDGMWVRSCRFLVLTMWKKDWSEPHWVEGKTLSYRDVRLLDFLMNWQVTFGKDGEYFYCKTKSIKAFAYIKKKVQEAAFKSLRDKGLIDTEMRGNPRSRKRYIRIRYKRVCAGIRRGLCEWNLTELGEDEEDD